MSVDPLESLQPVFREDAAESLAGIEQILAQLSTHSALDDIRRLYRLVHSLKGGAATFGYAEAAKIAHEMETLLSCVREGTLPVTPALTTLLIQATDALHQALRDRNMTDTGSGSVLLAMKTYFLNAEPSQAAQSLPPAPQKTYRLTLTPKSGITMDGPDPLRLLEEVAALGTLATVADQSLLPDLTDFDSDRCYLSWQCDLTTRAERSEIENVFFFADETFDVLIEARTHASHAEPVSAASVHVRAKTIEALLALSGEILSAQGELSRALTKLKMPRDSEALLAQTLLGKHLKHLQETVVELRMQPVQPLFARFPRLVRELAASLGKTIHFVTEGDDTRLDCSLVEKLAEPLTHLIRNALDHGIEASAERERRNKPATGTLRLSARHGNGRALITVSDDGKGIDRDALRKKISAHLGQAAYTLPPAACDEWIFHPGITTKETVSEISGRGVGMDAVKAAVQSLGGTVILTNQPGAGLSVTLSLPLTLALVEGVVFEQGNERYLLPLTAIETIQAIHSFEAAGPYCHFFLHAGERVPLCRLQGDNATIGRVAIYVKTSAGRCVVTADTLLGTETMIFHVLALPLPSMDHYSGAGQLADGTIAFVIDAHALMRRPMQGAISTAVVSV